MVLCHHALSQDKGKCDIEMDKISNGWKVKLLGDQLSRNSQRGVSFGHLLSSVWGDTSCCFEGLITLRRSTRSKQFVTLWNPEELVAENELNQTTS